MKLFKNLFKTKEIEEENKDNSIQKSICSLMIEVAYADNQLEESELKAMAEAKNLEGYKSLKKGPLIELLKSNE